jgi:hypothetical protein
MPEQVKPLKCAGQRGAFIASGRRGRGFKSCHPTAGRTSRTLSAPPSYLVSVDHFASQRPFRHPLLAKPASPPSWPAGLAADHESVSLVIRHAASSPEALPVGQHSTWVTALRGPMRSGGCHRFAAPGAHVSRSHPGLGEASADGRLSTDHGTPGPRLRET